MKTKSLLLALLFVIIPASTIGQTKIDTLYYDKDWKGIQNGVFATYYRLIEHTDDATSRKPFRDYFITGELQSEGGYITIDKYDDNKSVMDGEFVTYYKSGQIEKKGTRKRGNLEGEWTHYGENGLIKEHCYFKNGKLDGLFTQFTDDGLCVQIEYKGGNPADDSYIVSNSDGYVSKMRLSDKTPIYESPSNDEMKRDYKGGYTWLYYNKNGITVGNNGRFVKDYGKYDQYSIIIGNSSFFDFDFNPDTDITLTFIDKKGEQKDLKVYSAAQYMKKVKRKQNNQMFSAAAREYSAASHAGYSGSTTRSTYSGSYGGQSYSGSSTSSTTSYSGAAAYQASAIASSRLDSYENSLLSEREALNKGYLRRTTIHPGETISGFVNCTQKKRGTAILRITIHGAVYEFRWNN